MGYFTVTVTKTMGAFYEQMMVRGSDSAVIIYITAEARPLTNICALKVPMTKTMLLTK